MTDNPTNTPAPGGDPSKSASADPSGASSDPSKSAGADSFVKVEGDKPAGDAAAAAAAKAEKPHGLADDFWDAEKGAVKIEDLNARLKEAADLKAERDAAKAADETRKASLPKSAEEYKPALPKGLPDGIKIDVNDARFKAAQKFAHDAGLTQDQFSALLGIEAQRAIAGDKMIREAIAARDAALGPNGAARVDAIIAFQKTIAPNDKVAGELAKMLVTPGIIETFERIQTALGSQGVDALRRSNSDNSPKKGDVSDEDYRRMSFAEQMILGEQRRKQANAR